MAALGIMISIAITRPGAPVRAMSCWLMTAWRTNDSLERICPCWCGGKTSMTRLMVETALLVWSVANTRWPVSLMVSAASMVSRSRISPMRTTSGS